MISALCVTFGRVRFLQRALADFLAQEGDFQRELLIVNTLHKQKLLGSFPNVRIINLDKRPASLGEARNIAVKEAFGDRITIYDDDDKYLPHHLKTFADNWTDADEWIWLTQRLWADGDILKGITSGCHGGCFGFTKKAWESVGGYPPMTVGEDRVLVNKIVQQFPGKKIDTFPNGPPFICVWGQGTYHASGLGDDKPGCPGAYARASAALAIRITSGEEKMGDNVLVPDPSGDWANKARLLMERELKKNSMNDLCVVELGRYGDIINILPILHRIHNEYAKPTLMVSRPFADLLEGVSYVNPHVVDIANDQLALALKVAKANYRKILCAQVWGGPVWYQDHTVESYNKESWKLCGFLHKFDDFSWKPVFDRRDKEREQALIAKLSTNKPMLLVNLTHSISSPFKDGEALLASITETLKDEFNVVNLGGVKLHRIYDLLGLMEVAACVVSVDSAMIHLAAAVDAPTVALTNPAPWLGTIPRGKSFWCVNYNDATAETVIGGIREQTKKNQLERLDGFSVKTIEVRPENNGILPRRLFHCVERHQEKSASEANRKGIAQKSWTALYAQGVIPCHLEKYPRDSASIAEFRKLPFLKDVLEPALKQADPRDIIFFTNDDNVLHPELPNRLQYHVGVYECACSQRCEFRGAVMPPIARAKPEEFAKCGMSHMGRDLFAFTADWLTRFWEELPDFILGCSEWDLCVAAMIRKYFGIKTTRKNLESVIHPAEIPRGYVNHAYHPPAWNKQGYQHTGPGQLYNRKLFQNWSEKNAPHLVFDKFGCI